MLCANPVAISLSATQDMVRHEADVLVHAHPRYTAALSGPDAPERTELEQFIRLVFHRAYGARIRHFMPQLMSLRDADGRLLAVCGLRNADREPLFLETYLEAPVEQVIAARTGDAVGRGDVVEVGNLAVAAPGIAPHLLASVSRYLHGTGTQWAVFTAIPLLRNSLARLNMPLEVLADATLQHIDAAERPAWGSYYARNPQVLAVRRAARPDSAGE